MSKRLLTDAFIKKKEDFLNLFPNLLKNTEGTFKDSSYILIVRLLTKIFAKLTIYPLNRSKILKLIFIGFDFQDIMIEETIKKLKEFNIIHTSGLTSLGDKSYYECYLDLSFIDKDYKDLQSVLDKIKNIFEDIRIEEINLK